MRLIGILIEQRRARRDFRALCNEGRAPLVSVDIRLITDRGDDWTGMTVRGVTGQRTTIPLTRDGERHIAGIAATIRKTCIRQVFHAAQQDTGPTDPGQLRAEAYQTLQRRFVVRMTIYSVLFAVVVGMALYLG